MSLPKPYYQDEWGANCFSSRLPLGAWLIWDKRFSKGRAFLADAEAAWMSKGHGIYIYSETSQGCIRNEPIEHPTQKPLGLMTWCLNRFPKAQLIADPFMGSGTTLVAAKQLGRKRYWHRTGGEILRDRR